MTNVIIAISMWCGTPNPGEFKANRTNSYVNACRKELFECINKNPNGTGFMECFKTKEIGY